MIRPIVHSFRKRGIDLLRKALPWGSMLQRDIALMGVLPYSPMLFDVGANIGQTLQQFKRAWPKGTVHCFEPTPETYETLLQTASRYQGVHCHQLALSSESGLARLARGEFSVMNHVCPISDQPDAEAGVSTVPLDRIDLFCREHDIDRVHLLKIDTEGHDLEVLRGASAMLKSASIDMILTEVGFDAADCFCRDIDIRDFLDGLGYRLLGIYDQNPFYDSGRPHTRLYFANMLFARPELTK